MSESCCVLTRGEFFISDITNECGGLSELNCSNISLPFNKVGNVSSAQVGIESTVIGKENKYNPMKDICSRVNVSGVELTITFECASALNLYRALAANQDEDSDGTGIRDFCIANLGTGDFFPFNHPGVDQDLLHVYLRDSSGGLVKELILDDDFKFTRSGIEILKDVDIGSALTLRLYYGFNTEGYNIFKFLTKLGGYKKVFFKGTNYAGEGDTQFDCEFHRVLFAPISKFDLITKDEFLTITLNGAVELDKSKGEWFKITKQE